MPTLESTDEKITPKSILRHRPIGDSAFSAGKRSITTTAATPIVQRASRPRTSDVHDDVMEWKHVTGVNATPTASTQVQGTTRRTGTPPKTGHTQSKPGPTTLRPKGQRARVGQTQRIHPLLYLGIGMISMLVLWTTLSAVFGWFNTTLDDIRYGRPRTFQTDAWVGHNEQTGVPSHFVAVNLNRHIEIIEIPGGDAAHARIYVGPQLYGANDDLTPVTLSFVDVNGDHKPDMIITFQGSRLVYINDQGGFRPLLPSERPAVERFLLHWGQ